MRKCAIVIFFVLVVTFVCYYSINPCYKPAEERTGLNVSTHNDDTIRIAYLGDSWVHNHKIMKCVLDSLIYAQTRKPVQIRNAGIGGLTSKEIYNAIFTNKEFKSVVEWGPDFCFVSAGINDCNKKMGSQNYKENMRLLISLLLNNNITPIVLEIPYYDIYLAFWKMPLVPMLRSIRSMIWTHSSVNCINSYSNSYNNLIIEQRWQDMVVTIKRNYWNPNGYKDQRNLYTSDRMHLNQDGYFVLDSCIASQIINFLLKRNIETNSSLSF